MCGQPGCVEFPQIFCNFFAKKKAKALIFAKSCATRGWPGPGAPGPWGAGVLGESGLEGSGVGGLVGVPLGWEWVPPKCVSSSS